MKIVGAWYAVRRELETTLNRLFEVQPENLVEFDSLLSLDDFNALGYARNFPHLSCLMCSIDAEDRKAFSEGEKQINMNYSPSETRMGLLPATCYKVYLGLQGQALSDSRIIGCIAKCFRYEDKALDEYRAFNFTMKEFVCLGSSDIAKRYIEQGAALIEQFMTGLNIRFVLETASDPFFDMSSSVAVLSKALPMKQEILFNGHAVASLNYHRNYFGRKLDITLNSEHIHTSCVAFGLERWIAMFKDCFQEPKAALDRLEQFKTSIA
jgi:hypothetical protein